jgi:hypothetical protein
MDYTNANKSLGRFLCGSKENIKRPLQKEAVKAWVGLSRDAELLFCKRQ